MNISSALPVAVLSLCCFPEKKEKANSSAAARRALLNGWCLCSAIMETAAGWNTYINRKCCTWSVFIPRLIFFQSSNLSPKSLQSNERLGFFQWQILVKFQIFLLQLETYSLKLVYHLGFFSIIAASFQHAAEIILSQRHFWFSFIKKNL